MLFQTVRHAGINIDALAHLCDILVFFGDRAVAHDMLFPGVPPPETECVHGVAVLPFIFLEDLEDEIVFLTGACDYLKHLKEGVNIQIISGPFVEEVEINMTIAGLWDPVRSQRQLCNLMVDPLRPHSFAVVHRYHYLRGRFKHIHLLFLIQIVVSILVKQIENESHFLVSPTKTNNSQPQTKLFKIYPICLTPIKHAERRPLRLFIKPVPRPLLNLTTFLPIKDHSHKGLIVQHIFCFFITSQPGSKMCFK